jgi:ParB-like nuclease domain
MRALRRRRDGDLLDLEDVERRLRPISRRYLGVRAIAIDRIVGTEGRAGAFTRAFEPRHGFSRDRLRSLASAFPDGGFPPIVAVKLGDTYFVIDGHHRVAFARRLGAETIDADVTEFVTRVPLPPGADMLQVVLRELERVFLEESGLAEARPGVRVAASRPALYLEVLENLQVHGYHLMREHGGVLDDAAIAGDWYDRIYAPVINAIDRDRLRNDVREAPDADLFLLLHRRRRDAFPSCGCPPLEETVDSVVADAQEGRRRLGVFTRRRAQRPRRVPDQL